MRFSRGRGSRGPARQGPSIDAAGRRLTPGAARMAAFTRNPFPSLSQTFPPTETGWPRRGPGWVARTVSLPPVSGNLSSGHFRHSPTPESRFLAAWNGSIWKLGSSHYRFCCRYGRFTIDNCVREHGGLISEDYVLDSVQFEALAMATGDR